MVNGDAIVSTVLLNDPKERLSKEFLLGLNSVVNDPINPIEYLAADPGGSNGICGYDSKCYLQLMLTIPFVDLTMFLEQFDRVHTCIMEDYRVFAHKAKAHINSKVETVRAIGRIESWAERKKIKLVSQGASIKNTGYNYIGQKAPSQSDPLRHVKDANVHFMFWAVSKGKIDARDLLR